MSEQDDYDRCCGSRSERLTPAMRERFERVYAPEELGGRRRFLQTLGGAVAAGTFAGCSSSDASTTTESPSTTDESVTATTSDSDSSDLTAVEGTLVLGEEMEVTEGRIRIEDGQIESITEQGVDNNRLIVPAFVNPHTHITDATAKDGERARNFSWFELFIDPGLKSEINNSATRKKNARL